jgi:hypothetical protein
MNAAVLGFSFGILTLASAQAGYPTCGLERSATMARRAQACERVMGGGATRDVIPMRIMDSNDPLAGLDEKDATVAWKLVARAESGSDIWLNTRTRMLWMSTGSDRGVPMPGFMAETLREDCDRALRAIFNGGRAQMRAPTTAELESAADDGLGYVLRIPHSSVMALNAGSESIDAVRMDQERTHLGERAQLVCVAPAPSGRL